MLTDKHLLPESYPGSAAWKDLAKGAFVGAAAAGIGLGLKGSSTTQPVTAFAMAAASVGAGALAFMLRSRDLSIPENIAENQARKARRDAWVAAVNNRNAQRLAQTKLTITPTSGVAR